MSLLLHLPLGPRDQIGQVRTKTQSVNMTFIIAKWDVHWNSVHKQNPETLLRPLIVTAIVCKREALHSANLNVYRNVKEQSNRAKLTDVAINKDLFRDQADVEQQTSTIDKANKPSETVEASLPESR